MESRTDESVTYGSVSSSASLRLFLAITYEYYTQKTSQHLRDESMDRGQPVTDLNTEGPTRS